MTKKALGFSLAFVGGTLVGQEGDVRPLLSKELTETRAGRSARFVVFLVKDKGAPILTPVD